MKSIEEHILQLWEDNDGEFSAEEDGFVEVAAGEWKHGYKRRSSNYVVIKAVATDQHYYLALEREGDYYDGYDYSVAYVKPCKPVKKVITEWLIE